MWSLLDSPAVTEGSICDAGCVSTQVHEISHCPFASENRLTLRQNVAVPHLGSQERSSVSFSAAAGEATEGAEITPRDRPAFLKFGTLE